VKTLKGRFSQRPRADWHRLGHGGHCRHRDAGGAWIQPLFGRHQCLRNHDSQQGL